jgi:antitoxin VapB
MTQANDQDQELRKRRARLFRNGRSQAVRIPKDLEFPGSEVILRKEGDRLVIEPAPTRSGLLRALASMTATAERLPDVDRGLRRVDDVEL